MDQVMYAVGGYDGTSQLASVERYSVDTDQWTTIASMQLPRSALSLCALNNKIYAIGMCALHAAFTFLLQMVLCQCPARQQREI